MGSLNVPTKKISFSPLLVIGGLMSIILLGTLFLNAYSLDFSAESLVTAGVGLAIVVVAMYLVAFDSSTQQSIEFDGNGISYFPNFPYKTAGFINRKREFIYWREVDDVVIKGQLITVKSGKKQVTINQFLFDEPKKLLDYVATSVEAHKSSF